LNKSRCAPGSMLFCAGQQGTRRREQCNTSRTRSSQTCWTLPVAIALGFVAMLPILSEAQSLTVNVDSPATEVGSASRRVYSAYVRPTEKAKLDNYLFEAYGPYPVAGAAVAAGINQFTNSPPEWNQGVVGYSRRFGSDFGILAISTTTQYGLSEAFKEDSLYYRCDCTGVFPRLRHAVLSSLTARRGSDGHRVFSIPALVAPYAGTMTAVYGWYPSRFDAKDAFRTGNYALLAYIGSNVSLEFLYSGPNSLLRRMHLNNPHGSPLQGPNK